MGLDLFQLTKAKKINVTNLLHDNIYFKINIYFNINISLNINISFNHRLKGKYQRMEHVHRLESPWIIDLNSKTVRQSNIQLTCYKYHGNSVRQD